jgi:hypothetical protein
VTEATERLIERLAATAVPVRRLRPPVLRAALFLLTVAAVATPLVLLFADLDATTGRWRDPMVALEFTGALLAGIAGVVAAFQLCLPDRARAWALLPMPFLAVWIATSGAGCYAAWLRTGDAGLELGEGAICFGFILGTGLPLGAGLLWMLRRARPLSPAPVAAIGGLGAAALGAELLQFFHPFDITVMDLGMHALAVAIVVATASLSARISPRPTAVPT